MFSYCRQIQHLISKTIRTRNFFSTPTLSILKKSTTINGTILHWAEGETNSGLKYRIVKKDDIEHFRILLITDPEILDNKIYCSVRIDYGSNDDPKTIPGVAHLYEHLFARHVLKKKYHCTTYDHMTNYVIRWNKNEERLKWFLESFFQQKTFSEVDITTECRTVDVEWLQKRSKRQVLELILKNENYIDSNIEYGNLKTKSHEEINFAFKHLQDSYMKRPVLVCLHSQEEISLEHLCESLTYKKPNKLERLKPEYKPQKQNLRDKLFVVKSNERTLTLLTRYLFTKRLNSKQSRTLEFFCHMFESNVEGSLQYYLRKQKLGTNCSSLAVEGENCLDLRIELTENGLNEFEKVNNAFTSYLKFLHEQLYKLEEEKKEFLDEIVNSYKEDRNVYTTVISFRSDVKNDEFSDEEVFGALKDKVEEKALIKEQIIDNTRVVYAIFTRAPEDVARIFKLPALGVMKTEQGFGTEYKVVDYKTSSTTETEIGFPIKNTFTLPYYFYVPSVINEAKHVAYKSLCQYYLKEYAKDIIVLYPETAFYRKKKHAIMVGHNDRSGIYEQVYQHMKHVHSEMRNLDQVTFDYIKNCKMTSLAKNMTNSENLARLLLETAIENTYFKMKVNPIPMEYDTMSKMTLNDFNNYLLQNQPNQPTTYDDIKKINASDKRTHNDDVVVDVDIKALDKSERLTVTLYFLLRLDEADKENYNDYLVRLVDSFDRRMSELSVYNPIFDTKEKIGISKNYEGILLITKYLASDTSVNMPNELDTIFKAVRHPKRTLHRYRLNRRICIQIVGHENTENENKTFEECFEDWLQHHKDKFTYLIELSKGKPKK